MASPASRAGTARPSGPNIFSVAQHSVLVEFIAKRQAQIQGVDLDRRWRLAMLLHDAPEYVIGDMISPFKAVLGGDYKVVEARLLAAVSLRFGLPPVWPADLVKLVKAADRASAFLEATRLAGFDIAEAKSSSASPSRWRPPPSATISPLERGRSLRPLSRPVPGAVSVSTDS